MDEWIEATCNSFDVPTCGISISSFEEYNLKFSNRWIVEFEHKASEGSWMELQDSMVFFYNSLVTQNKTYLRTMYGHLLRVNIEKHDQE